MPPDSSPGRFLGMMHRHSRMHFSEVMEPLGLPEPAFPLLVRLYREDDLRQDELVQFHRKDKATIARALFRLEEGGFITRRTDPDDRRVKRVKVTAKARRLEPKVRALIKEWDDTMFRGFSREERKAAMRFLGRMAENARAGTEGSDE